MRPGRATTATDAQIDRLVHDLNGLTEEEIQIVEGHHENDDSVSPRDPATIRATD